MTDAISAIRRDEQMEMAELRLLHSEAELLKKYKEPTKAAKKEVNQIINNWMDYLDIGMGYSGPPSEGLARRHVLALTRWVEGRINYEDLSSLISKNPDEIHYWVAVGGHGRIMGDTEQIIRQSLKNKYGKVPHSFNASVDEQGNITLEKLTCEDCPASGACNIYDKCNGYEEKSYNEAAQRRSEDEKEYKQLRIKLLQS
ncbi:MAG: hypothetical protein KC506_01720 [Nanoarchaeota archaeon]|nr:hypothetical protein [Nanoarchaeota archaeon]